MSRLTPNAEALQQLCEDAAAGIAPSVVEPQGPFADGKEQSLYELLGVTRRIKSSFFSPYAPPQFAAAKPNTRWALPETGAAFEIDHLGRVHAVVGTVFNADNDVFEFPLEKRVTNLPGEGAYGLGNTGRYLVFFLAKSIASRCRKDTGCPFGTLAYLISQVKGLGINWVVSSAPLGTTAQGAAALVLRAMASLFDPANIAPGVYSGADLVGITNASIVNAGYPDFANVPDSVTAAYLLALSEMVRVSVLWFPPGGVYLYDGESINRNELASETAQILDDVMSGFSISL